MNIPIKQLKKWIAALDSGEYKQGFLKLQIAHRHCCLGVGCRLFVPEKKLMTFDGVLLGRVPKDQPAAPEWLVAINDDFFKRTGEMLSSLNDCGYTFPEIATLLELVYVHKILD